MLSEINTLDAQDLLAKVDPTYSLRSKRLILWAINYAQIGIEQPKFSLDDLLASKFLSQESESLEHMKEVEQARENLLSTVDDLITKGFLRQTGDVYEKSELFEKLVKIVSIFSSTTKKLVVWYLWGLHSKGLTRFSASEIEQLLPRGDFEVSALQARTRRVLKSLGVSISNQECHITENVVKNAEGVILSSFWPSYGIIYTKMSPVKISARQLYVDVPNSFFSSYVERIRLLYEQTGKKEEELFNDCDAIAREFNRQISDYFRLLTRKSAKQYSPWFRVWARKNTFGYAKVLAFYRVNWAEFTRFQEQLSSDHGIKLAEKYDFLMRCRGLATHFAFKPYLSDIQNAVQKVTAPEIERTGEAVATLAEVAKLYRGRLERLARRKHLGLVVLDYFPELINTVRVLDTLARGGAVPSCYREMRKIIENLDWVLLDDVLASKMSLGEDGEAIFLPALRKVSREWFEWANGNRMIVSRRNLQDRIEQLSDNPEIAAAITHHLTYPLFVLLMAKEPREGSKVPEYVPKYGKDILGYARRDLRTCLGQISYHQRVDQVLGNLDHFASKLAWPTACGYPSNEVILELFDSMTGLGSWKLYDEYSLFVHSYFSSWSIFPFSSVLELKVLSSEMDRFSKQVLSSIEHLTRLLEERMKGR